jgi:hypothetical protein
MYILVYEKFSKYVYTQNLSYLKNRHIWELFEVFLTEDATKSLFKFAVYIFFIIGHVTGEQYQMI